MQRRFCTVFLFLTAGALQGSVITSGTITLTALDTGVFDFTLSDGVHFGGTVNYNFIGNALQPRCNGCTFALPSEVSFNNVDDGVDINGFFSGGLVFNGDVGTGNVVGPYDYRYGGHGPYSVPCALPGNISTNPDSCYEPISGTVAGYSVVPYFGPYTETVYTLGSAPELSTFLLLTVPLGLVWWRRRNRCNQR